jgi:thiol-disulfide isomerase/thioredoxin
MAYNRIKFVICFISALMALCVMAGCKKEPQKTEDSGQRTEYVGLKTASEPVTVKAAADSKPTLSDIIATRRGWGPAYRNWYGKDAPDFKVIDINGQLHTLSNYRGKNVMLIFWATWCGPCIGEIPHLIELRKTTSEDKLAMLAISYIDPRNSTETVKRFVAANPIINYTIISADEASMPRPYNLVNGIPCSFFIDPEGKIKLATEGMIPISQMKAIIEAER